MISAEESKNIKQYVEKYRKQLFEKFVQVGQGHPGSTFSMLEMATTLYHGGYMNYNLSQNKFENKCLISKGHATVTLYPMLVEFGLLSESEWINWGTGEPTCLRVFGNKSIPGIDMTSGSLGHGIGVGAGMAIADPTKHVYVIISEGELYEGSTWEALLFVNHHKISNMTIFIDINNLIILGKTDDCLKLNSIHTKLKGFENLELHNINGHNVTEISMALNSNYKSNAVKVVLAKTVKGNGFSLMENKPEWHYMQPITPKQVEQCREEMNNVTA